MTDLIVPGDIVHDSSTGTRVTIIELRPDGFVVDQTIEPNKPKSSLNHFHRTWSETFEIISGTGRYSLDNQEYDAVPGHSFIVKPGQAHIHPWNTGTEELRFRQSDTFEPSDPSAAVDTFLGFSTLFGMARDGKTNRRGMPTNPLQGMVVLDFFRKHGGYVIGMPAPLQDLVMITGSTLGRAFGYRPWYEQYLPRNAKQ